jgi:2-succinyl-6-hydroxy-2,4-cyclohexadiene-1-carboxylate synthase
VTPISPPTAHTGGRPDRPVTAALAHTERGSGERVVLVHGFTQNGRSFEQIVRRLASSYEVVTVDLPGHGGSTDVAARDLDETARLVGEVGGAATYLGYSLGGRVCLTLALASPHLVDRLVLISATAGIIDATERASRRISDDHLADELDPPNGAGIDLDSFLDRWLAQPLFADLGPEAQDRGPRRENTPAGLAHSLRTVGTGTQIPSYERLGEITAPTLLVAGSKDEKFSALARAMAAAIGPQAAVALVEGAGHAAPFEAPERFLALVGEWLAAHPAHPAH